MGIVTDFASQSIHVPRGRGLVQSVLSQIGGWMLRSSEPNENINHLNSELRNDIGLEPNFTQTQPFAGWQP